MSPKISYSQIFTIIVLALGIYPFLIFLSMLEIYMFFFIISIVVGLVVWVLVGKIATTDFFIGIITKLRRAKITSPEEIKSAEKGFFMLKSEKIEKGKVVGLLSHISETLEKPGFAILFLIGILSSIGEYTGATPLESLLLFEILIFAPVVVGVVIPPLWIFKDSNWMYFDYTDRKIERANEWFENLFKGFAGGGAILGFAKILVANWGVTLGAAISIIFMLALIFGMSGFMIVVTVFFYLFLHRRFVETTNSKLERMGMVTADLSIIPAKEGVEKPMISKVDEPIPGITPPPVETIKCPSCGEILSKDAGYCSNCGAKI